MGGSATSEYSGESQSDKINYFDGTLVGYFEYSSGDNICLELQFDNDDQTVIMKFLDPNYEEQEGTFSTDGDTMNFSGLESEIEYIEPNDDAIKSWIKGYNLGAKDSRCPQIDKAETVDGKILKFEIYDDLTYGAKVTFYGIPKDNLSTTNKVVDYSDSPFVGSWKCTNKDNYYLTFNVDGTVEVVLYEGHNGVGTWKPSRINEIEFDDISGEWSYDKQRDCIINTEEGTTTRYFTRCE